MNTWQLVEVAALISAHSSNLIESESAPPRDALQRYWSCSRARLRTWVGLLDAYPREVITAGAAERQTLWERTERVITEVFVTEIVTRVWGAVLTASDRRRRSCDAEAIARDVLICHLEARRAALQLMVGGPFVTLERISQIDRLRRRVERWTDVLLGHLTKQFEVRDFAFDLDRALDFGTEQLQEPHGPRRNRIWQLYRTCIYTAFPEEILPNPLQEQFRIEIIKSILACFPAEMFETEGPLKSTWVWRMTSSDRFPEGPPPTPRFPGSATPVFGSTDNPPAVPAGCFTKLRRGRNRS